VMLFARLFDVPRRERADRTERALAATGMLEHADRLVSTYSGGMVRRLELAQALVNRPRLLILDEPTIGLDPIARGSVWDLIAELRAENGMTVLLTTHYMDEAEGLCDRVALMHRGRLRADAADRTVRTCRRRSPTMLSRSCALAIWRATAAASWRRRSSCSRASPTT